MEEYEEESYDWLNDDYPENMDGTDEDDELEYFASQCSCGAFQNVRGKWMMFSDCIC